MISLRARIKTLQTMAQAVFNALVIAGFKMQIIVICLTAPVTSVQCVATLEEQRARHVSSVLFCHDQKQVVSHTGANTCEELTVQISLLAPHVIGILIEAKEDIPVAVADHRPFQTHETEATAPHLLSLAA